MTDHVQTSFCNWKQSLQSGCRDACLKRRRCRACCELVPEATFKVFKASFQLKKKKRRERKSYLNTQSRLTDLGDWKWRFWPRHCFGLGIVVLLGRGGAGVWLLGWGWGWALPRILWTPLAFVLRGLQGWLHRSPRHVQVYTHIQVSSILLSLSSSIAKCSAQEQCFWKESRV